MPIVREPLDPKTSLWHFLAYYLRFMREKQGLSLTQWGRIIGAARSSVSNMEAGRHMIQDDHIAIIDKHFATGGLFEIIHWYARTLHNSNWFRQYTEYEAVATAIKIYHGQVIPLVLQTDEATWAYVLAGSPKDFEAEFTARIARKRAILDREDPPLIWVLIDEAVLLSPIGGPEVMKAQLQHLREMADLPHVIVRIIPFSAGPHLGIDGPIQIISLESRDIAYSGAQGGGRLIESPGEAREMTTRFDRIGAKAASEDGSRRLIERYLERYMRMTRQGKIEWRKSSRSGGADDSACVELARLASGVGVRDSKHPTAGHLALTPTQFATLLTQAKHGDLDR